MTTFMSVGSDLTIRFFYKNQRGIRPGPMELQKRRKPVTEDERTHSRYYVPRHVLQDEVR